MAFPFFLFQFKDFQGLCEPYFTTFPFFQVDVKETDHDSGVDCVMFLQSRAHATDTATLLSTGSGGWIRAWCMFGAGLAGEFMASNNHRESILCMTSDEKNERLITGDTQGYIKIWNISKYCIGEDGNTSQGTFSRNTNRAQRLTSADKTPRHVTFSESSKAKSKICRRAPPLVLCLRAHLQPIVSIDYVPKYRQIITASFDCSLRLWRCDGQYVGTFGQRSLWNVETQNGGDVPFDLQRAASSSRKRWSIARSFLQVAGRLTHGRDTQAEDSGGQDQEASAMTSTTLQEAQCRIDMNNILGKFYKPKTRHHMPPNLPKLRMNKNQIVVYTSLKCNELSPVVEPKPPVVTFQTNSKPSPRVPSSKSDKDAQEGKTNNRLSALGPRWKSAEDGVKTRARSPFGTRRIKVQDGP